MIMTSNKYQLSMLAAMLIMFILLFAFPQSAAVNAIGVFLIIIALLKPPIGDDSKKPVKIKNIITDEERAAFLTPEEDAVIDEKGKEFDMKVWRVLDASPGFMVFVAVSVIICVIVIRACITGEAK
jgi:hypothetical protein